MKEIRVLLLADTPAACRKILDGLKAEPGIRVSMQQEVRNGNMTWAEHDVILLSFENSLFPEQKLPLIRSFLKEKLPVICIAETEAGLEELRGLKGCSIVKCGKIRGAHEKALFEKELLVLVKSCYRSGDERRKVLEGRPSRQIAGIGASTGGPKALLAVLHDLPSDMCGIAVVQHLSRGFAENFAHYMDHNCQMHVRQAVSEEVIRDGTIYVAPEGCQMRVKRQGERFLLYTSCGKQNYDFCPSADCLFESMAEAAGERAMGIILTGMGSDGARGILKMKEAGACTVGQDRETSDIYSMPYEAMRMGGIQKQLPLGAIAKELEMFDRRMKKSNGRD